MSPQQKRLKEAFDKELPFFEDYEFDNNKEIEFVLKQCQKRIDWEIDSIILADIPSALTHPDKEIRLRAIKVVTASRGAK